MTLSYEKMCMSNDELIVFIKKNIEYSAEASFWPQEADLKGVLLRDTSEALLEALSGLEHYSNLKRYGLTPGNSRYVHDYGEIARECVEKVKKRLVRSK